MFIENENPDFNEGFSARKRLPANSAVIYCTIPLNRFSLFEVCANRMLPDAKFELRIKNESDGNLIWRQGTNVCRIIITNFQLLIPEITPVANISYSLSPLVFLNEYVTTSHTTRQKKGEYRIVNSISNPRHVYVFFLENSKLNSQTANPFLYDTFTLDSNKTLRRCYLKVNNDDYPAIHYSLPRDESRLYQKIVSNNETLLNKNNFKELYPFVYDDLSALKDKQAKISFCY